VQQGNFNVRVHDVERLKDFAQTRGAFGSGFGAGNQLGRRRFRGCAPRTTSCHNGGIVSRIDFRQTLGLLFAVIIAFGRSLWGSFHFDDYSLFSADLWRPFEIRPLTYLTFWLNQLAGGRNPVGYHAVNLLLHVLAVLVFWAALRRLVSEKAAWIAAAIFAVHPFQAEPVNYIFARSSTLAALLCLAALWSWARDRRWWAVVWFGAAALAKEECVAFPALLLLLEAWKLRKREENRAAFQRALAPIVAMFALSVAAGLRVLLATSRIAGSGAGVHAGISWKEYGLAQGLVMLRYLRMLIVPWGFTVDPDIPIPPVWLGLLGWAVVATVAIVAAALAWRGKYWALWFLAGSVLLAPSSSILPAADLAADRRLYLAMIGFATAAGLLLERMRPAFAIAVVAALACISVLRTETWRTEESLWQDAVIKAPAKVRPKIQLARAVEPGRGLEILEEAKRLAPGDPRVPSEEGRIYLGLGRPDQALVAFGRALALDPGSADAYNNRGVALLALDQKQAAEQDFERALAINACQFDARMNLEHLRVRVAPAAECRFSAEQSRALEER
jgi:protein O-mannosyl-transferase